MTTVIVHDAGAGSPCGYMPKETVEREGCWDLTEMAAGYDPLRDLVAMLLTTGRGRTRIVWALRPNCYH
jgi:hypothetical protein